MSTHENRAVIGIDSCGTKIAAAVLTPDGVLHEREHVPTEAMEVESMS